jgi:hypothetical protein
VASQEQRRLDVDVSCSSEAVVASKDPYFLGLLHVAFTQAPVPYVGHFVTLSGQAGHFKRPSFCKRCVCAVIDGVLSVDPKLIVSKII